jgi:hypothetical protein
LSRREVYKLICGVAEREYADIVQRTSFDDESARIYFVDESFLEVWLYRSENVMKRYAFHWERRHVNGKIFRHDNAPHVRWRGVKTFPKHFHHETEINTIESRIPDDPMSATKYFLNFVRDFLKEA